MESGRDLRPCGPLILPILHHPFWFLDAWQGITPQQLRDAGTQIILSNTYHLFVQPGSELIQVRKVGET